MSNITADFRAIVLAAGPHSAKNSRDAADETSYDLYTKEAYRINQHISSLKRFLLSIRRAYLSTDVRHSTRKQPPKPIKPAQDGSLFSMFPADVQQLTDRERDEIDFQAKLVIRQSMDRIKDLEEAEKIRQETEAAKPSTRLMSLFNTLSNTQSTTEDILGIHRSSITWLLNKRLMEVSNLQKNQQEIRLRREIEKSENQLFRSTALAAPSAQDQASSSSFKPTKSTVAETWQSTPVPDPEPEEMDAFEEQISQEQLQMLEKENSVMLEDLNNTLNQVRTAEKALLEISNLQSQLTHHLAVQTLQTERLYGDSIATTERVEQGNLQLIQSRERNKAQEEVCLCDEQRTSVIVY
ncbi:hypothetical protein J3Q64DRAFT_1723757 [Phycomyces blakesleeanus]|uniref:SNARE-complex protein Syntaxin-18 N-terminal domain-containing protein n=2 Tax=Phycomyces blakesleeanus TaxID=4837 RepID=A0ABR3B663_PHYBL